MAVKGHEQGRWTEYQPLHDLSGVFFGGDRLDQIRVVFSVLTPGGSMNISLLRVAVLSSYHYLTVSACKEDDQTQLFQVYPQNSTLSTQLLIDQQEKEHYEIGMNTLAHQQTTLQTLHL